MKGVVLEGERRVVVTDVPDATLPGPDGAILTVEKTAICGSDLHLYHAIGGFEGTQLGHEFIGRVAEIGPDVRDVRVGDRVLVSGVIGCGHCVACRARDPVVCRGGGHVVFGTRPGGLPGGQAEAVGVPSVDAFALPIPDEITDEQAVLLTDILPTGYLGAASANISPGSNVLVIGLGPVGLLALRCVQLFTPGRVFAVDPVPERRARAEALGATAFDPAAGVLNQLLEETGGWGADSIIEAVGADQTIIDSVLCAAPGGTVSIIGVSFNAALPFPMLFAFLKRLTIRTQLASIPTTWDALVPLIANGKLQPDDVFTHRLGLSEAAEGYRLFDAREEGALKVLMDPTA